MEAFLSGWRWKFVGRPRCRLSKLVADRGNAPIGELLANARAEYITLRYREITSRKYEESVRLKNMLRDSVEERELLADCF